MGCLSDAEKAKTARDEYYNDMHQCVVDYNTKDLIDACRADVKKRWGK